MSNVDKCQLGYLEEQTAKFIEHGREQQCQCHRNRWCTALQQWPSTCMQQTWLAITDLLMTSNFNKQP